MSSCRNVRIQNAPPGLASVAFGAVTLVCRSTEYRCATASVRPDTVYGSTSVPSTSMIVSGW